MPFLLYASQGARVESGVGGPKPTDAIAYLPIMMIIVAGRCSIRDILVNRAAFPYAWELLRPTLSGLPDAQR